MNHLAHKLRQFGCFLIISLLIATLAWQIQAQSVPQGGPTYEIEWSVLDSGGGHSSGGDYAVTSSLGQGTTNDSGAEELMIESGYVAGLQPARYGVYLSVIARE